jgi:hypothetical protein
MHAEHVYSVAEARASVRGIEQVANSWHDARKRTDSILSIAPRLAYSRTRNSKNIASPLRI